MKLLIILATLLLQGTSAFSISARPLTCSGNDIRKWCLEQPPSDTRQPNYLQRCCFEYCDVNCPEENPFKRSKRRQCLEQCLRIRSL